MDEHLRIYHAEKPCFCGEKFKTMRALNDHKRIYHGIVTKPEEEKPKNHICEDCGSSFLNSYKLERDKLIDFTPRFCVTFNSNITGNFRYFLKIYFESNFRLTVSRIFTFKKV